MMKPKTPEVCYSFDSLYFAAYGKNLPLKLKSEFQKLPQEKINALVSKWANLANWKTDKRMGEDGLMYLSFHP